MDGLRPRYDVQEAHLITPIVVITHAAFSEPRHIALQGLTSDLRLEAPGLPVRIIEDHDRRGSLWCWRKAMESGLDSGASHIIWLPDDAIVCKDFGRIIKACIEARPDDVFDCYVNMDIEDRIQHYLWYTTPDGFTGMAGVFPRHLLIEHLKWRDDHPELETYPNDAGVNLWAMTRRAPILKTAFSLVTHDDLIPSLDGHDGQDEDGIERKGLRPIDEYRSGVAEDVMNFLGRTYAFPLDQSEARRSEAVVLGRTYAANHHALVRQLEPPDIRAYWSAQRHGAEVSKEPMVYIAIPNGGSIKSDVASSLLRETNVLLANGIGSQIDLGVRDSLITRSRDRIVANFMESQATHLLMWDSDIIPTEPGFVLKLLHANLPLVAGTAPFKNDTGHVVVVLDEAFKDKVGRFNMPTVNGCVEVKCAGTGIMMIRRDVIGRMMRAHLDKMYVCHVPGVIRRVEWALFQDAVRDMDRLSEDWEFCLRWRDLGEHVYIHPELVFEHIGERAYRGSFHGQYGAA